MALAARATSSTRCAAVARPPAPCSSRRRPRAGGSPSPRWRPGTTRSSIVPPAGAPYGSLAKAAAALPVPARETLRLKDPSQVPLHRQERAEAGRRARHGQRQGAVRDRHAADGHALRGGGAAARVRRQGRELRRRRGAQGAGRGERRPHRCRARPRPSSILWAAWRSWRRTPGPPFRAATRSRSPGTTAPTRATTP